MEQLIKLAQASVEYGFCYFVGYWLTIALILGIPARVIMYLFSLPLRWAAIHRLSDIELIKKHTKNGEART